MENPQNNCYVNALRSDSHWFNFQLVQNPYYSPNINCNGFYANRVCFTTDFYKSNIRQFKIHEAFLQQ